MPPPLGPDTRTADRQSHLRHVYQKLGINSRAQLIAEALQHDADDN